MTEQWPPLPYDEWSDTCETLQMWTQIVGKVKLELTPFLNEWWNVAFHLTARGLSTGLIPYRERDFQVEFDFVEHNLFIETTDGRRKALALLPRTVADFYADFMAALAALGIEITINTLPTEVPNPTPFEDDRTHSSYDPDPVNRWWRIMVQTRNVLELYRSSFGGKSSPIMFFWGSFDLTTTRFSGKAAPLPEGPRFFQLAEDQENIACGFWPGNPNAMGVRYGAPAFYSYIYPAPEGLTSASLQPEAAHFDETLGEFILRYDDVRRAASPGDDLLAFFRSAYESQTALAGWDRTALAQTPPKRAR